MISHLRNFCRCFLQKIKPSGLTAENATRRGKKFFDCVTSRVKKINLKNEIESISMKSLAVTSTAVMTLTMVLMFYGLGFRFGYHVYMDGDYVASVSDKADLAKSIDGVKSVLGTDYKLSSLPTARFAIVRNCPDSITEDIISNLSDITKGAVLIIDDKEAVTFASQTDASSTLKLILEENKAKGCVSAEFANNVSINNTYVKKSKVVDNETAKNYLTSYKTEPAIYTIGYGESLETVSRELMITKEELLNRNTALTEADFVAGTEIVTNCPAKILSVKSNFSERITEEIPFETKTIKDPDIYEGVVSIKTPGKEGKKQTSYQSYEIDGVRIATNIVKETILEQPVTQIEYAGTKSTAAGDVTGILTRPTSGNVTSRYGSRWGRMHNGLDIDGNTGDPILAADGGTVIVAGDCGDGYGYKVIIDHGNGSQTLYAHCNRLFVTEGTKVNKGDVIAEIGNTGYSTGSHLHFEVIINGQSVDPENFFKE